MKINIRNDKVIIEGYVNAIERNSKPLLSRTGRFIERICKGAFFNALKRNDNVQALLNHDHERMIGCMKDGSLELEEDSIGLRARLETSDPEVIQDARNGKLVGWSFGFLDRPGGVEMKEEEGMPLRMVKDLDLYEVSLLNRKKTPAYEGTLVNVRANEEYGFLGAVFEDEISERTDETEHQEEKKPIDYSEYERAIEEMKK